MIHNITKRDGSTEEFSSDKLNKWAEYATKVGGNWGEIARNTFKRLSEGCTSQDVHDTMIDVCLQKETIEYSRVAARLEVASIRKNMQYILSVDDRSNFKDIYEAMLDFGVWDDSVFPGYSPEWEEVYSNLSKIKMEYWQLKQWTDKYSCRIDDVVVETPAVGLLGIALSLLGDNQEAYEYAEALVNGEINLPTPALNGCRNGDFDTISCCVIEGGDTTESLGVANHIAYRMTAKKAGIGISLTTRTKGDNVKGGKVKHLGKSPLYKMVLNSVRSMTQISRGGNATMTIMAVDPEIENVLLWKSQRVDIEQRIDKMDYEFGYNDAFLKAVVEDSDWTLISYGDAPEVYDSFYVDSAEEYLEIVSKALGRGVKNTTVKARDLLKTYLTIRQETGRFYDNNLTRTNTHTPFLDVIRQSNLCEEVALPTNPYSSMGELYGGKSGGETAFCSLSAINVMKVLPKGGDHYERVAELALRGVDRMIDLAPMMTDSMKESINRRRSVGMGITGLAGAMYTHSYDYDGSEESLNFVQKIAERHYFYMLKASQKLSEESGVVVEGVDLHWLPIDTSLSKPLLDLPWEELRGKPRKHSVLAAHMPTESSAVFSSAPNGLYPLRRKVINKRSRRGVVQYICEAFQEGVHKTAWDVDNIALSKYYGRVQDYTDQAISADFYVTPSKFPDGKVPMGHLMKEWVAHAKLGNKTKYYLNTNDYNGGTVQDLQRISLPEEPVDEDEEDCESCKL